VDGRLLTDVGVVTADAVLANNLSRGRPFADWCEKYSVRGHIGEIGWSAQSNQYPGEWQSVCLAVIKEWRSRGIHVSVYSAGSMNNASTSGFCGFFKLATAQRIESASPNAAGLAAEARVRYRNGSRIGINVSGGDFGFSSSEPTGTYSNLNRPVYGTTYVYPDAQSATYLSSLMFDHVRMEIRWENFQPTLGGALDATEIARLDPFLNQCATVGLGVILDVHNYGSYFTDVTGTATRQIINNGVVTVAHFTDLWSRLSTQYKNNPAIIGYDLMNEPTNMTVGTSPSFATAQLHWEYLTQQAVTAIRATGDTKTIIVPGYGYENTGSFATNHPNGPWVTDSANNLWYTAHQYPAINNNTRLYLSDLQTHRSQGVFDTGVRGVNSGVVSLHQRHLNTGTRI
jgi:hypothetical protein